LEEVTSYFHLGLAESAAKNPISDKGYPTTLTLRPDAPLEIPYIMGIAKIPPAFDRVTRIEPSESGHGIILHSASGKQAPASVDLNFLRTGK
jgi:hypothetical protein